ncbi:hypothetical protein GCM10027048_33300 [Hymenobacter coalescens]
MPGKGYYGASISATAFSSAFAGARVALFHFEGRAQLGMGRSSGPEQGQQQ